MVLSAFQRLLEPAKSTSGNVKTKSEKNQRCSHYLYLCTYQIRKYLVKNCSTERTSKTAFLHKVLSGFQRLLVGTVSLGSLEFFLSQNLI
jgi:hypothetical protein